MMPKHRLRAYGWFHQYKNGVIELTLSDSSVLRISKQDAEYIAEQVNA